MSLSKCSYNFYSSKLANKSFENVAKQTFVDNGSGSKLHALETNFDP